MSNDAFARLWKLEASINNLVLNGKRDPIKVADVFQKIIDEQKPRFVLLKDLGVIVVPKDYEHKTRLKLFKEKNKEKFFFYSDFIADDDRFDDPAQILKPGDKLHVSVLKQIISGRTTSDERLMFLKSKNAILLGVQGVSLVFEQKRDELPKGHWYTSLDEENRWNRFDVDLNMPSLWVPRTNNDFEFRPICSRHDWDSNDYLLCFTYKLEKSSIDKNIFEGMMP